VNSQDQILASRLREALTARRSTIDVLAERTKVPRSTLRHLFGEPVAAVLPARVYLRGHCLLAAKELGLDADEVGALFDAAYPPHAESYDAPSVPRLRTSTLAVTAGLIGVGILAVILAFTG
jgi:cytoskeletal protein RodZ